MPVVRRVTPSASSSQTYQLMQVFEDGYLVLHLFSVQGTNGKSQLLLTLRLPQTANTPCLLDVRALILQTQIGEQGVQYLLTER